MSFVEAAIDELKIAVLNENKEQIAQYFESQPELTLRVLRKMKKKKFVSDLVKLTGGNKKMKGASAKLLKHLQTKIKSMSDEEISASESDREPTPSMSGTPRHGPRTPSMSMTSITRSAAPSIVMTGPDSEMVLTVKEAIVNVNNPTLTVYGEHILNYFRVNSSITHDSIMTMNKKDFSNALSLYCGSNKLRGPAGKLYKKLKGMDEDESDPEISEYTATATVTGTVTSQVTNQPMQTPILLPVAESGDMTDIDRVDDEQKYPESAQTSARNILMEQQYQYLSEDLSDGEHEVVRDEEERKYEIKRLDDEGDWKDPLSLEFLHFESVNV